MEADVDKHILTLKLMGINFCNPFLHMRCRPYVAHIRGAQCIDMEILISKNGNIDIDIDIDKRTFE